MAIFYKTLPVLLMVLIWSGCIFGETSSTVQPKKVDPTDMFVDMQSDMSIDMPVADMGNMLCDCPAPLAPSCQDGQTRKVYRSPGCDDENKCLQSGFIETTEPCDVPPAIACKDGKTAISYDPIGACANGTCTYNEVETPCEVPANHCTDANTLTTYIGEASCENGLCSVEEKQEDCGDVGCCVDHCCALAPSNTVDFGRLRATGINSGPPSGKFNTETDCNLTATLGQCVKTQDMNACVCFTDRLTISDLEVEGGLALVILANESIEVTGTLDLSGRGKVNGPGSSFVYNPASVSSAAGGGTFGSKGGRSPVANLQGTKSLVPLRGGCRGQDVCTSTKGGGAGGALQMTAGTSIKISGRIYANGGGGQGGAIGGSSCLDGSGGGSGGGVLIEAPVVEMTGRIMAQGGGGGGGASTDHSGNKGEDGQGTKQAASGGSRVKDNTCALYGSIYSGGGGAGAFADTNAQPGGSGDSETRCLGGNTYSGNGGGGGGVGRIRINTKSGAQSCLCGGTFSPTPTFGSVVFD